MNEVEKLERHTHHVGIAGNFVLFGGRNGSGASCTVLLSIHYADVLQAEDPAIELAVSCAQPFERVVVILEGNTLAHEVVRNLVG
jgi:hypothetical protein